MVEYYKTFAHFNMTLEQIKLTVEEAFNVIDMASKSRKGPIVRARRLAIWYAREKGYIYARINEAWNIRHDVSIYHNDFINNMIRLGDKETADDIWNTFGVDVTKDLTKEKLTRIRNKFDELLMSCPNSHLSELHERVEIMVKAYNYKHEPQQAEIVTSNALKIE